MNSIPACNDTHLAPVRANGAFFASEEDYYHSLVSLMHSRIDFFEFKEKNRQHPLLVAERGEETAHQESVFLHKVHRSLEHGTALPLEHLAKTFNLSHKDMQIVRLLFSLYMDWPLNQRFTSALHSREICISAILGLLCGTYQDRFAVMARLDANSPLLRSGLLELEQGGGGADLMTMTPVLSPRILNYVTASGSVNYPLDEIMELEPATSISQVVLPGRIREEILELVSSYPQMVCRVAQEGMSELLEFGGGLALLFHGPSGTGKTMMARAISRALGKPLLCPRWESRRHRDDTKTIKLLYREAALRGGIVFFDECDDLFAEGSCESNELLKEIEYHSAITILTVNEPEKLDPALNRRIMRKVYFPQPDAALRRQIWEVHLPRNAAYAIPLDIQKLASEYPLSGGQIRNAVQMCVSLALMNSPRDEALVLDPDEIFKAARHQCKQILDEHNDECEQACGNARASGSECKSMFAPCEIQLMNKLRGVVSAYERIMRSIAQVEHEHAGNSNYRQTGLKILVQCPLHEKGAIFAKALFSNTNLRIIEQSARNAIRWLGRYEDLSNRRERYFVRNNTAFFKAKSEPSAIVITDASGLALARITDSDPAPGWDRVFECVSEAVAPLVFVTTASHIPSRSFRNMFHYVIDLQGDSEQARINLWRTFCDSQGLSADIMQAFTKPIAALPQDLFLNALQAISLECLASGASVEQEDIARIVNGMACPRIAREPLFGKTAQP